MVHVQHFGEPCNAILKFRAADDVRRLKHVLAENTPAVADAGDGADADKMNVFVARDILSHEFFVHLHLLMLLDNLPGDVFHVGVVRKIAVEGECAKLHTVVGSIGDADLDHAEWVVRHGKVARQIARGDCFFLTLVEKGIGILNLGVRLLLQPGGVCFFISGTVVIPPAGTERRGHVQAAEIRAAGFVRHTRHGGYIGVARTVDKYLGIDGHPAALGIENDALDVIAVHLHIDAGGIIQNAAAVFHDHLLQHEFAVFGVERGVYGRQRGAPAKIAFGFQAKDELLAVALDHARNLRDVAVCREAPQGKRLFPGEWYASRAGMR